MDDVPYILVKFRKIDCTLCPVRTQCTGSATAPCALSLLPGRLHHLLGRLRTEQQTPPWKQRYAMRAGPRARCASSPRATACADAAIAARARPTFSTF
ncbi:transposase [Streptomyces sp. NPDC003032]